MESMGFAGKCKGIDILSIARCISFSKVQHTLAAAAVADSVHILPPAVSLNSAPDEQGYVDTPEWKKFKPKDLGLATSMINKPAQIVLRSLQKTVTDCSEDETPCNIKGLDGNPSLPCEVDSF